MKFILATSAIASAAAIGVLLCAAAASAKPTYVIIDAGQVNAINDADTVVGTNDQPYYAFIRTVDGSVTKFTVQGHYTQPTSINNTGVVAGTYQTPEQMNVFLRATDGSFSTPHIPGKYKSVFLNNNGDIAGFYAEEDGPRRGYLRTADGNLERIDIPGSAETIVSAINDAGAVAGTDADQDGFIRAADGTIKTFRVFGSDGTYVTGLNNEGAVSGIYVVGYSFLGGFIRSPNGTIQTFHFKGCPGYLSYFPFLPSGMLNASGVTAGLCAGRNPRAFVRHPDGTIRRFHVPGQGLFAEPMGVNAAGVIAGYSGGGGFMRFPR